MTCFWFSILLAQNCNSDSFNPNFTVITICWISLCPENVMDIFLFAFDNGNSCVVSKSSYCSCFMRMTWRNHQCKIDNDFVIWFMKTLCRFLLIFDQIYWMFLQWLNKNMLPPAYLVYKYVIDFMKQWIY